MPPHSSHAQIAARFLGCALIIVPLVRGYMSFRPRMDFDGQNHAGRPSQQSYVKIPSEWRRCVWVLRYGHMKMPSRFQSVLSLVVTGHDAVTKCWGTFVNPYHGQGKTISTILTKVSWKRFRHRWYFFLKSADWILLTPQRQVELPVLQIIWGKFRKRTYYYRFRVFSVRFFQFLILRICL